MKTFILSILFLATTVFTAQGQEETVNDGYTLTVTVPNARSNDGKMMFSLNTKNDFMRAAPFKSDSVAIVDGVATVTFKNVPAGEYAVMVLHDKNENMQMDFENNGMPKEDYGMSNNPMSMGPPSWADAKFDVTDDATIKIVI
ncbi:DUF2141 domain-containing protein [Nonlabens ponticola]|uniref:DUF2141 domain-containing protein n=1 Tax=Nonlabens ponticola TaxID=2496866 RepID=A0A3S9N0A8_9FLAO|nr:DUF2141 domain-containing protein [Nonlabens ponticola]AZQ44752.1 DUF2141 domain-containing protein [Nonlabens ponticola]